MPSRPKKPSGPPKTINYDDQDFEYDKDTKDKTTIEEQYDDQENVIQHDEEQFEDEDEEDELEFNNQDDEDLDGMVDEEEPEKKSKSQSNKNQSTPSKSMSKSTPKSTPKTLQQKTKSQAANTSTMTTKDLSVAKLKHSDHPSASSLVPSGKNALVTMQHKNLIISKEDPFVWERSLSQEEREQWAIDDTVDGGAPTTKAEWTGRMVKFFTNGKTSDKDGDDISDSGSKQKPKTMMIKIRTPPLLVKSAQLHGVGSIYADEDEGEKALDTTRKFKLTLEATCSEEKAIEDPELPKKQEEFVLLMRDVVIPQCAEMFYDKIHSKSGLPPLGDDVPWAEIVKKKKKGTNVVLSDKLMNAHNNRGGPLEYWESNMGTYIRTKPVLNKKTNEEILPADPEPGQIFRFSRKVFKKVGMSEKERENQLKKKRIIDEEVGSLKKKKKSTALGVSSKQSSAEIKDEPSNNNNKADESWDTSDQHMSEQQELDDEEIYFRALRTAEHSGASRDMSRHDILKTINDLCARGNTPYVYKETHYKDAWGNPIKVVDASGNMVEPDGIERIVKPGDYVEVEFYLIFYSIKDGKFGMTCTMTQDVFIIDNTSSNQSSGYQAFASSSKIAKPIVIRNQQSYQSKKNEEHSKPLIEYPE